MWEADTPTPTWLSINARSQKTMTAPMDDER
jgi:hypothetical protein